MARTPTKERITVSLSRDSVKFLNAIRAEAHSPSMSALFERIVADLQGKTEMERLDEQMDAYYSSLKDQDIQADRAWGALGEAVLASQVTETESERHLAAAER